MTGRFDDTGIGRTVRAGGNFSTPVSEDIDESLRDVAVTVSTFWHWLTTLYTSALTADVIKIPNNFLRTKTTHSGVRDAITQGLGILLYHPINKFFNYRSIPFIRYIQILRVLDPLKQSLFLHPRTVYVIVSHTEPATPDNSIPQSRVKRLVLHRYRGTILSRVQLGKPRYNEGMDIWTVPLVIEAPVCHSESDTIEDSTVQVGEAVVHALRGTVIEETSEEEITMRVSTYEGELSSNGFITL